MLACSRPEDIRKSSILILPENVVGRKRFGRPPVRRAVLGSRSNPGVHVQITLPTVEVDEPNAPGSRAQIEARNRYRKFEPSWTGTAGIEIEHAIAFYP
jgi:hypothetical protein